MERSHPGFTLVEVLIVMGLITILSGLTVVNLVQPQKQASLASSTNKLLNDLRSQQARAMAGISDGTASAQEHGVFIESNKYTLFSGPSFNVGNPNNFVVTAEEGITFDTNFPSDLIIFSKLSGEIASYNQATSQITLSNQGGATDSIALNRYGVFTLN